MAKFLKYCILVIPFCLSTQLKAIEFYPPYNNSSYFTDTEEETAKFTIYISQGQLNIKYNKPNELLKGEVIVYNLLGQEITRKKLEAVNLNQISIPVQNTCYIVRIQYSGKIFTQKIIVSNEQ